MLLLLLYSIYLTIHPAEARPRPAIAGRSTAVQQVLQHGLQQGLHLKFKQHLNPVQPQILASQQAQYAFTSVFPFSSLDFYHLFASFFYITFILSYLSHYPPSRSKTPPCYN